MGVRGGSRLLSERVVKIVYTLLKFLGLMASYWDIMDIFLSSEGKYIHINTSILDYTQEVVYNSIKIIFIYILNIWKWVIFQCIFVKFPVGFAFIRGRQDINTNWGARYR